MKRVRYITKDTTINEKLYAAIGENVNQCADNIFKYSPQMFYIENENEPIRPIAWATCVLYENNSSYYLITASHVFERIEPSKIGILINDVFSLLHGFLIYTNDKENKIDLAIMKLAKHFVADILKQYSFLQNDSIGINHNLTNKQEYLMAGFPVSKTKVKRDNKTIKREELIILTMKSQEEKYKKLNIKSEHHIIVDIHKVKDFKDIKPIYLPPHLYGVSGSGLWFISSAAQPKFSLVAIMTEWHKRDKVAVGTKIDVVIDIIKHRLDSEYKKTLERNS